MRYNNLFLGKAELMMVDDSYNQSPSPTYSPAPAYSATAIMDVPTGPQTSGMAQIISNLKNSVTDTASALLLAEIEEKATAYESTGNQELAQQMNTLLAELQSQNAHLANQLQAAIVQDKKVTAGFGGSGGLIVLGIAAVLIFGFAQLRNKPEQKLSGVQVKEEEL